jgi:hypothetical protein
VIDLEKAASTGGGNIFFRRSSEINISLPRRQAHKTITTADYS